MATRLDDRPETVTPTERDSRIAQESAEKLFRITAKLEELREFLSLRVRTNEGTEEELAIPASAFRLLNRIIDQMSKGHSVTVTPRHAKLTTQEAADMLNVSRPYLVQLLENGEMPFTMVGKHRRVLLRDVMDYKQHLDEKQTQALQDLADEAQELDMGY